MSRLSSEQVALTVRAADSLTEVFLVDSGFQLVAAGVGSVEAKVAPGLYKARFRVGHVQTDSLFEAAGADTAFDGKPVQFASAVPLPQTLTWRQAQGAAAQQLSQAVSIRQGSGSQLFLFLRGVSEEAAQPWLGVSLHALDGTLLAKAAQGADACCGLNIELNPGLYRLRVEEEPGEVYEMFVTTLAGWQTQVFALAEKSWLPGVDAVRAALPEAAVLMTEIGKGFDPANPAARQTELLRLALMHNRKVLNAAEVKKLLAAEPLNPMNAVYIAHILRRQEDEALTAELAKRLGSSLSDLPDMQAVWLGRLEQPPTFALPPMLNSSWQLLNEAASKEKAVIVPGSLCDQLQGKVLNTALWLLHRLG